MLVWLFGLVGLVWWPPGLEDFQTRVVDVVVPISLFTRAREVRDPSGFSHQRQGSKQTGHFILSAHSMQTLFLHGRITRLAFLPHP